MRYATLLTVCWLVLGGCSTPPTSLYDGAPFGFAPDASGDVGPPPYILATCYEPDGTHAPRAICPPGTSYFCPTDALGWETVCLMRQVFCPRLVNGTYPAPGACVPDDAGR